jgi:hypothetical protein
MLIKKVHKKIKETLKGSLSCLKLMPGTYLSQTGNPLHMKKKIDLEQCFILFLHNHVNKHSHEHY